MHERGDDLDAVLTQIFEALVVPGEIELARRLGRHRFP
jgi:hypothetical protein